MFRSLTIVALAMFFASTIWADEKNPKEAPEKNPKAEAKEGGDKAAAKKEAAEQAKKKESAEGKKPVKEGVKEGAKEAPKDKGRIEKIGVDGQTIKLLIDGKKYAFVVSDDTRAMLKTREEDGKEIVLALQLFNAADMPKKVTDKKEGAEKKEAVKKGAEKSDGEAKKEAKPEAKKQPKEDEKE